jgi:2-dehydropantoate 2-reductase
MHTLRRLVVVGPGAIGCLLGRILSDSGRDVWLLDRRPDRADRITRQGLLVETAAGARRYAMRATADAARIGEADLVLVCVKAHDTAEAMRGAAPLLGAATLVLSIQNGLGNLEIIARSVPRHRILAGTTTLGAIHLGPGHIRHAGEGMTILGAVAPEGRPRAAAVVDLLRASGAAAGLTDNIPGLLWSKLVVNAAIGPLSAVSGRTNGELLENPELRATLAEAAREAADVARAKGVRLLYPDPVAATEEVCRTTAPNLSSMLQDIRGGRRTEIEAINGVILREARALCVPAPVNARLYEAVLRLQAAGPTPPSSKPR